MLTGACRWQLPVTCGVAFSLSPVTVGLPGGLPSRVAMVGAFCTIQQRCQREGLGSEAVSAELLAMLLYILIGIGTIITSLGYQKGGSKIGTDQAAFTIAAPLGLLTTVLMHIFGQVSSARINPAITLSMLITRRITPLRAFLYGLAQYLGAILGSAVAMINMGDGQR